MSDVYIGDASEVLMWLRAHRHSHRKGEDFADRLYRIYLAVILFGITCFFVFTTLRQHPLAAATAARVIERIPDLGPSLVALLFLVVARFATWQGPVVYARPDVALLLATPLARADVVRPRLRSGLILGAALGAVLGGIVFIGLEAKVGGPVGALLGACVGGFATLGLLASCVSWEIERSRTLARRTLILSPAAMAGIVVTGALGVLVGWGHLVALWSGPWGWVVVPIATALGDPPALWPLAPALLLAATVAMTVRALGHAGEVPLEELGRRAELGAGLAAARYVFDLRGVVLLQRESQRQILGVRRARLRRPRRTWLVLPWRDAVSYLRAPGRVWWAGALAIGAVTLVTSSLGTPLFAIVAILLGYLAAARLVEPMRIEADNSDAARRLPWRWGDLVLFHGVVPWIVLSFWGVVAAVAASGLGAIEGAYLLPVAALAPLVAGVLTCCAVGVAGRGRMPIDILFYGPEFVFAWFMAGPLLAAIGIGIPSLLLGTGAGRGIDPLRLLGTAGQIEIVIMLIGVLILRSRKAPE